MAMFSPKLLEKVATGQQSDRLHEAEIARLLNEGRAMSLKLTVAVSGIALIALIIVQMGVI